jgi:hypothetical protein
MRLEDRTKFVPVVVFFFFSQRRFEIKIRQVYHKVRDSHGARYQDNRGQWKRPMAKQPVPVLVMSNRINLLNPEILLQYIYRFNRA